MSGNFRQSIIINNMDPAERESRMRSVVISRIGRELDQSEFLNHPQPMLILKNALRDIEQYKLYMPDQGPLLQQSKNWLNTLEEGSGDAYLMEKLHSLILNIFINYRIANQV